MATWLHRAGHCAPDAVSERFFRQGSKRRPAGYDEGVTDSRRLLRQGFLATGWSHFAAPGRNFLRADFFAKKKDRAAFGEYFASEFSAKYWRTRFSLWSFIAEMRKGDWVLVPTTKGRFSVYELLDDQALLPSELAISGLLPTPMLKLQEGLLHSVNGGLVDLGFFRRIKPVAVHVSKRKYADSALIARMQFCGTTLQCDDLRPNIERALAAYQQGKSVDSHGETAGNTWEQVRHLIQDQLSPDKFALLVKQYFERIGAARVEILSRAEAGREREADADIAAVFEMIETSFPMETVIYVQVEHHIGAADASWARRQIAACKSARKNAPDDQDTQYWVVSSCDEFENEKEVCREARRENISLINGGDFAKMLLEADISHIQV